MAQYSKKHSQLIKIACMAILGCVGVVQALTVEVKEGNTTCIKAELSASLSIMYSTNNGTETVSVPLPDSATVGSSSTCGGDGRAPSLVVTFGSGHSLALSFSSNSNQYRVSNLTVGYNLSDSVTFPASSTTGVASLSTASVEISAGINTTYRCLSTSTVTVGESRVNVTFSNVRMEAYMTGTDLSPNETICTADQIVTTETVQQIVNLLPNQTKSTGSCDQNSATLWLLEERTNLSFSFVLNSTSSKYHLSGISLSAVWPDMSEPFSGSNGSLDYLRGTLGRSYMCSAEQTLFVLTGFSVNTFQLQVQPFGVSGEQFGAAEECQLDEDNMLIPIIVGAALAGLVLIVLIAYLIGRKRSHAGYQTI
ncbi:hypothetical protein JZ751_028094 [Albula glossodonta]|uniref:Lysosome-associated membrane glycoprotein 1 n=1 Tax=Albula glossodonta TaxID=121402 RepID=A0A8T2PD33_9TELE|nr:hypothetical protein JZ751_028094 [Albula glossodonta]